MRDQRVAARRRMLISKTGLALATRFLTFRRDVCEREQF
ncbi:hypothetical protein PSP6_800038 [Paraburkholderia tropica]|nr:hypothetical protein PSP6_800038 [Paraburkholderia tropica]